MNKRKEKTLAAFEISEQYADELLEHWDEQVVVVEDLAKYKHGNCYKNSVMYDGISQLVLTQKALFFKEPEKARNDWIQCICYIKKQEKEINRVKSGGTCFRTLKSKIKKAGNYSEEEFEERLNAFQAPYDPDQCQFHFMYQTDEGKIQHYTECQKYDIHGAYASVLQLIFPRAAKMLNTLYLERKIKPENKALINYFVGMLVPKGFDLTFNWIVHHIRAKLIAAIDETDGILIYANTDGFAVTQAEKRLATSNKLGDFGLEYEGDIFTLTGENFWIMQCGDDITGNMPYKVRSYVDLREGLTVSYKQTQKKGYSRKITDLRRFRNEQEI